MAGVDAHYAYVGGYKLEQKIGHHDFAHPLIEKAQNPMSFRRTLANLDRLVHRHGFDVIHAHLTYDHWLARLVVRNHAARVARTVHARRVLRADPFTRSLLQRTQIFCAINATFLGHPALRGRDVTFTPPPLDERQFRPDGPDARERYGIAAHEQLVTVIGKLSKGRGFEAALETFAVLRRTTDARMMIIGHGEHRPALESLAHSLGIASAVVWAGYHEDDLAEHYRASNVLLFTAAGSDEGHRALLEAMACGVAPACYPIEGVRALTGDAHIADAATPGSLAALAASLLGRDLSAAVVERSREFAYDRAAARLLRAYATHD